MTIPFNQIPDNLRTPAFMVEHDNSRAVKSSSSPKVAVVIGQRLAAGTVAAGVLKLISSDALADSYWGRGSQLARACKAFRAANKYAELWAIALDDDAGGSAAAGSVLFAGTATEAGTVCLYLAGQRITVAVAKGDAAAAVATAAAAAVALKTDSAATAAVDGVTPEQLNVTARHKGTLGDAIDLRLSYYEGEKLPAGITATITAMTGGATDPGLASAITALGDMPAHAIVQPYAVAADLTLIEAEMDRRWDPTVELRGMAYTAANGSQATMTTLGNGRNSEFNLIMPCNSSPTHPAEVAAITAAIDLSESDPARPRQTLELVGMLAPAHADRWTATERNVLLFDGIATFTADSGGKCRVERLITTYQKNPLGVDDPSYLDVTTVHTLSSMRGDVRDLFRLRYPRHKLADDGTDFAPGQPIMTPSVARAEILALARETWVRDGRLEGYEQFKTDLLIERSATDTSRLDGQLVPNLVNGFRVGAFQLQFLL